MLLVTRSAITRAHRPGIELAAMAVVVAHLDGLAEALRRIAAAAGGREGVGDGIGVHVPLRPVERRVDRQRAIPRWIAEERGVVHARGAHDLARVHETVGIE